ncbi:MAG: hypothetical protein O2816_07735 [Planctomycetota bacterium]|nr:hypothetical protein [Planctomycetota bacterium]
MILTALLVFSLIPDATLTVLSPSGARVVDVVRDEAERSWVDGRALSALTGLAIKPEGLCSQDACVPWPRDGVAQRTREGKDEYDLIALLDHVGAPLVRAEKGDVWSIGEPTLVRAALLEDGRAPEVILRDRKDSTWKLSEQRGKKVLLVTWASW